jgi:hypothetical protein
MNLLVWQIERKLQLRFASAAGLQQQQQQQQQQQ